MSRLRRLKEKIKKSTIKTTMASLALVLSIGSTQVIGTYALFTDTVDVPSDLSISTGDVDVEVREGKDFTDVQPGQEIEIPVTITNQGTLNQNIKLELETSNEIKGYLEDKFVFNGINIKDGVMYDGEELFVLAPGSSITGSININVSSSMSKEVQNSLAGKKQNVDLTVKSTQISDNKNEVFNNGFYDEVIQNNTITVAKREILTIAIGENAYFTGGNSTGIGNQFKGLHIPVNVIGNTDNIASISATVKDANNKKEYTSSYVKYKGKDYISIKPANQNEFIEFDGVINITINVTTKDGVVSTLKCNVTLQNAGNNCKEDVHPEHGKEYGKCHGLKVEAGVKTLEISQITVDENQPSLDLEVPDIEQKPDEETKDQSEPEEVEPPREEVEVPSEPEVVEQPKEELVVPSKPDIIAPSKEEIEIQE